MLSGWLLWDDVCTFQYYFTKLSFQHFYERKHPWGSGHHSPPPVSATVRIVRSQSRYLNSIENCDRILDSSTSAREDTRFVKFLGKYLGLYY